MTPHSNSRCVLKSAIMVGVILFGAWSVYPQTPATPKPAAASTNLLLPKNITQYLRETVDWYRHLRLQEQIATDASDLTFLDDDRQLAKQIVQLSFDFARAEAKLIARQSVPAQTPEQASESTAYSGLAKAATAAVESCWPRWKSRRNSNSSDQVHLISSRSWTAQRLHDGRSINL